MSTLTITRPDDWHLHLRDGEVLRDLVPASASWAGRAIVMPNLKPPVRSCAEAEAYRERILAARPSGSNFEPLMTLYLTDETSVEEIERAHASPYVHAVKYYPAGATTNSASGVRDLSRRTAVLERMQRLGLPLLIHGEVTDAEVDIFDRERVFVDRVARGLVRDFPELRIVLEHITTEEAAAFVGEAPSRVGATITPQHLLATRNDMLVGGIKPHYYCLPVLKRERDRLALVRAATGGDPSFFLGTDSAPHAVGAKQSACGCAGCFTATHAIELYASAFEAAGALEALEGFASHHGPNFYGLPPNTDTLTLERAANEIPATHAFGAERVRPFWSGRELRWRRQGDSAGA